MTPALTFPSPMDEWGAVSGSRRRQSHNERYGVVHKTMRKRVALVVRTGKVECARCGELIDPSERWELDHRDDGRGYLGASHQRCNSRAGWEAMVAANGGGPAPDEPMKWSRRWIEEPAVGTVVFLGEGLAEVHMGGGLWQTIDASDVDS